MKGNKSRSITTALKHQGIALMATAIALACRLALDPFLGDHLPYVIFFVAIAFTTWYANLAASVTATVLSGLAACTATTLRMYATHKGWELTAVKIDVRYDVDDEGQHVIERTITVPADLTTEQRDRLARIAERTPVTLAIRAGTPISTTFLPRDA